MARHLNILRVAAIPVPAASLRVLPALRVARAEAAVDVEAAEPAADSRASAELFQEDIDGTDREGMMIKRYHAMAIVAVLSTLCVPVVAQTAAAGTIQAPYQQLHASIFNPSNEGASPPIATGGVVLQFNRFSNVAGQPNIFLYNGSTPTPNNVQFWPSTAKSMFFSSVTQVVPGKFAIAGQETKLDGSKINFLALTDPSGGVLQFTSTGEYLITQLAVAPDGSFWTVGAEHSKNEEQRGWDNYDILRHYAASGVLLEHFLPRWGTGVTTVEEIANGNASPKLQSAAAGGSLGRPAHGAMPRFGASTAWRNGSQIFLSANQDLVLLVDGIDGIVYVYNSQARTLRSWSLFDVTSSPTVQTGAKPRLTGIALTTTGKLYLSIAGSRSTVGSPDSTAKVYIASFNATQQSVSWTEVNKAQQVTASLRRVLGASGEDLVYIDENHAINWSHVSAN